MVSFHLITMCIYVACFEIKKSWHILIYNIFSIPDLESAAEQLAKKCKEHKVNTVFIATDAPMSEYVDIKEFLKKEDIKVRI